MEGKFRLLLLSNPLIQVEDTLGDIHYGRASLWISPEPQGCLASVSLVILQQRLTEQCQVYATAKHWNPRVPFLLLFTMPYQPTSTSLKHTQVHQSSSSQSLRVVISLFSSHVISAISLSLNRGISHFCLLGRIYRCHTRLTSRIRIMIRSAQGD